MHRVVAVAIPDVILRIASVCVGAFALAAAGLLDGRAATTHWEFAEELGERFPHVRVRPEVLYVDEGQVLISAGIAAESTCACTSSAPITARQLHRTITVGDLRETVSA